jgi:hypothetical protein
LTPTKEADLASARFQLDDRYRALGQNLSQESVHGVASLVTSAATVVVGGRGLGGILQLVVHRRDHDCLELILL